MRVCPSCFGMPLKCKVRNGGWHGYWLSYMEFRMNFTSRLFWGAMPRQLMLFYMITLEQCLGFLFGIGIEGEEPDLNSSTYKWALLSNGIGTYDKDYY